MIKVAIGSAKVLGLSNIRMDAQPTTAHLMTPGRCIFDCKFCTQARSSNADEKLLSRIAWPEFEEGEVLIALEENQKRFQRVCLQVVHSDGDDDFIRYVESIRSACNLPISVDAKVDDIKTIQRTFEAGADVMGLPLDAANSEVFSQIKKGSLQTQKKLISDAAERFPGRISTHLIVGLGEQERDVVKLMQDMQRQDVHTGLFAFTPIKGTSLSHLDPPKLESYRRIQMARFLIYQGFKPNFNFNPEGKITSFGFTPDELRKIIEPQAFQTSGCPGCNRPFYNERPGGILYNYPYEPSKAELERAFLEAISGLEEFNDQNR